MGFEEGTALDLKFFTTMANDSGLTPYIPGVNVVVQSHNQKKRIFTQLYQNRQSFSIQSSIKKLRNFIGHWYTEKIGLLCAFFFNVLNDLNINI